MTHRLAVLLLFALAACSDPVAPVGPTGLPADAQAAVVGTWNLVSVKDIALPWRIAAGPESEEHVVAGAVVLHDNGNFTRTTTFRMSFRDGRPSTERVVVMNGTYTGTVESGSVSLRWVSGGVVVPMQVRVASGNLSLTEIHEGNPEKWLYTR